MAKRFVPMLAIFLMVAGCVQSTQTLSTPSQQATAKNEADAAPDLALIPAERPVISTVHFHEEIDDALADFQMSPERETLPPRDFDVNFGGIHPVLDEFARPVDAYVFQYDAREFDTDSVDFSQGFVMHGHYSVHSLEYAFSAADAHLVGVTDRTTGSRSFVGPDSHFVAIGPQAFAFMFSVATSGNVTHEVQVYKSPSATYYMRYEPSDLHPLPGECQSYELRLRVDPPEKQAEAKPEAPEDVGHSLICAQPGEIVPLWSWDGSQKGGSVRTTRLDPSFTLPAMQGEALPKLTYKTAPWSGVAAPLPGVPAVRVPPSSVAGDWADKLAQRVRAFELDPRYQVFRAQSEDPAVSLAVVEIPPGPAPSISGVQLPVAVEPLAVDSLLVIADAQSDYVNLLYRTQPLPALGQQLIPQPSIPVLSSSTSIWGHLNGTSIPAAGELETQLAPAIPGSGMLAFWYIDEPGFGEFGSWYIAKVCDENGGAYANINAIGGYLESAGQYGAGSKTCQQEGGKAPVMPAAPGPSGIAARLTNWQPWRTPLA